MSTLSEGPTLGDGEAAFLLAGEDLLARDNIPDNNQRLTCFSCENNYVGLYCHNCGQKNDDMRRSLFSLILEMLGNITAFDSRIWRTWIKLLTRPGKVAREYADGSRTKWTSPVRAYLAMSILLFSYIALTSTQIMSMTMDVEREDNAPQDLSELKPSQLRANFDLLMLETTSSLEERRKTSNVELVDFLLKYPAPLTFDFENGAIKFVEKEYIDAKVNSDKIATDENVDPEQTSTEDESEATIIINGKSYSEYEASYRGVEVLKLLLSRPQAFNNYFSTYLPRVMLLMMPFTMFLGIIFIRGRKNALLYDHLVHSAYIHAVFFFLLFIGLILGQHTPIPSGALLALLTLYMMIYLPMSVKSMFNRGPIKTIWTSYAIGFVYFITMMIIISTLTIYALIDVAQQTEFTSFAYSSAN